MQTNTELSYHWYDDEKLADLNRLENGVGLWAELSLEAFYQAAYLYLKKGSGTIYWAFYWISIDGRENSSPQYLLFIYKMPYALYLEECLVYKHFFKNRFNKTLT